MIQRNALTWFITGCSTGFGRELARVVVARGYRAAVTARDPKQVADLVPGHEDRALALRLDVTDPAQVAESVRHAEEHFGGIDVLVNNAGIGYFAAFEESEEKDTRPDVRDRLLRTGADDPRGPAGNAEAPHRAHHQHLLHCRVGAVPEPRLLLRGQVRGRGAVRVPGNGGRSTRDQGDARRAERLPH